MTHLPPPPADRVCPSCGNKVSPYRYHAHRKSAACRVYTAEKAAVAELQAVGGYERIVRAPVVKASGLFKRPTTCLAAGFGDLGDLTLVTMAGTVYQLLAGEWEIGNFIPLA